ncbi:unnamed protein product [Clonostachys rosea f. rosea IK726]|uniref:Uncharacterized protein n=1 Tax=Clonostachys rosea f. rosea IK726 TaxID=1349383 RepID=A0ACA9TSR2_BIOOC|nr:unnamed protein product [Clonostachys rosea f. rosea IK726]
MSPANSLPTLQTLHNDMQAVHDDIAQLRQTMDARFDELSSQISNQFNQFIPFSDKFDMALEEFDTASSHINVAVLAQIGITLPSEDI